MGSSIEYSASFHKVVVGLGNPGSAYAWTRHNIGADIIRAIAQGLQIVLKRNRFCKAEMGEVEIQGKRVLIVIPYTYMNLSGESIQAVLRWKSLMSSQCVVIVDDLETEFGAHQIVFGGGARGHNGIRSIHSKLQTRDFFQIRCGVGRPVEGDIAEYVLSRFSNEAMFQISDKLIPQVQSTIYNWVMQEEDTITHNHGVRRESS